MFTRTGGGTLNCDTCGASINAVFPDHPLATLHAQWHAQHDRATEPADAVVQDILDLLEPVYSVSASADMSTEVGERRHDPHCPLGKPCRGLTDGLHSELWVIGGCRMDRPVCEACMAECLCSMIEAVRTEEQENVRERIDIAYLEGREAVQREATKGLTALLADYDDNLFTYTSPRSGLVEALAVLAAVNADWGTK